jgi:hypothetical protein
MNRESRSASFGLTGPIALFSMGPMIRRTIPICGVFLLVVGTLTLAAGCGSACKDLADKVCGCQPTRAKIERCRSNVDAAARNSSLSDEQESRCQGILDGKQCTCTALQAGNLSACGLSNDPTDVFNESN